ncbi:MAG: exodeoxyribonuclease VII small subunit [Proteobacteria bacterium]|jgi:exodeoxyribonuclease VII small subunit|nr:exodeoxyribonuclease VII small subunit [Pseudomonadota bacterium]NCA27846.1 exodeoxyribonuclease VII small subunit [Pseudomonadota bacterium]
MTNVQIEKNNLKKISKMSFEEAISRLEEVAQILSSQKINLEQMIELYEEGNALKEHCNSRLNEAKMKIDKIIIDKKSL